MTGKRVIFVGAVHEAVPALSVLLDSGAEIAEVVTLPAERAASTSGFVDLETPAGRTVSRCAAARTSIPPTPCGASGNCGPT